jgi:sulfur relay (sulfurtransferase) complex TusBCD TusD component (DsrE family)
MQTNKELVPISDERENAAVWNKVLEEEKLKADTCRYKRNLP